MPVTWARSVVRSSVIASARMLSVLSPPRFCNGRITTDKRGASSGLVSVDATGRVAAAAGCARLPAVSVVWDAVVWEAVVWEAGAPIRNRAAPVAPSTRTKIAAAAYPARPGRSQREFREGGDADGGISSSGGRT